MRASIEAGLASLLSLILCVMGVVGAPPSEFVQEPTIWKSLNPMMLPALFVGVFLALVASVLMFFSTRATALISIVAVAASLLGVILAWGVDADADLRALLLPSALLFVPVLVAADAIRLSRREH